MPPPSEKECSKLLMLTSMAEHPNEFDVRKSVHHHTIQIIQSTICNIFKSLLLDVYVWLIMFRASPRSSSGAYNCTRSLLFYRWRSAAGALLVVVCHKFAPGTKN